MANNEREPIRLTPEEIASRQVDGYIEKIEKRPELSQDVQDQGVKVSGDVSMPTQITDDSGGVIATSVPDAPEIDLPLSQDQVEKGLQHKVVDSVRWLAEYCVMMIKKYPGRVFYKQSEQGSS
jgi:hypothetical protein